MTPMRALTVIAGVLLCGTGRSDNTHGASLRLFLNSAFAGEPAYNRTLSSLSVPPLPVLVGTSIEVVATLQLPVTGELNITCEFLNATYAFLWIDDHLVCQTGAYTDVPVARLDLPLRRLSKAVVRAHNP